MKDIKGWEGQYAITSCGKVWSYKRKKFLVPAGYGKGYLQVWLSGGKPGVGRNYYVHRLVAEAYLPNPDNLPEVNHKDENKENPCLNNLEWCSKKYNINYGTRCKRQSEKMSDKKGRRVYCVELDKEFKSISCAAAEVGVKQNNLSTCLRGQQKTCGGYHWRYAD